MKNLVVSLSLLGLLLIPAQGAFAWEGIQSLNPMPYISYLNPLPYIGIGENKTNFSLNPFTGFKNCNKCKVSKCDACTGAAAPVCPTCQKAFPDKPCPTCQKAVVPKCPACQKAIIIPVVEAPACPCNRLNRY